MQLRRLANGFLKFVIGTTLGVSVAFLLALNALLLWVATGPRTLDAVTPYIERSLSGGDGKYHVSIGETWLIWDGWKHPIDLRLRNVSVLTEGNQRFSRFPEISVGVDVVELLRGRFLPTSLTISNPVLSLYQNEDRSISFGFDKTEADVKAAQPEAGAGVPFAAVLAPLVNPPDGSNLSRLRQVTILNADVSVGNVAQGVFFHARDVNLVLKKTHRSGLQAFGSAKVSFDGSDSMLDLNLAMPVGSTLVEGDVSFGQFMPGTLSDLFIGKHDLNGLKLPVRGKVHLAMETAGEQAGKVQKLGFTVDGGKGTVETRYLEQPLPVTSLHAEGELSNNLTDIDIKKILLDIDGMQLGGDGLIALRDGDTAIKANGFAQNVPAESLHMLWPPSMAPITREWITANITAGVYAQAEAHINIGFGDLAKPVLPKEAVDATVRVAGAKIRYLPEHPEMNDVMGEIHLDGLSMDTAITSGHYMKDTSVSGGKLYIADLNEDNPYIKLGFDVSTSGKDVVRFLGLPRLKHAQRLHLQEEAAEGTARGHVELGFKFFASHDGDASDDDITYDLKADVKNIAQPDFLGKFSIKNADGTVTLNNAQIEFKGSGSVNGATASEANVKYLFKPEGGFDTFIDTVAVAPVESLPRFGYPAFDFLKGNLGVKASLKIGDTQEAAHAAIDLTDAAVDFRPVRWVKPAKEPATLELTEDKKNDKASITSFSIKGKNLDGKGSAELSKGLSDLSSVTFDSLAYGQTRLNRLVYEKLDGGFRLVARGKSGDLAPWVESAPGEEGTFSFEHFPPTQLDIDVAQLYFGKGRELDDVKGTLDCDASYCHSASFNGKTVDGKGFNARIMRNPKGSRQLSLHAESAGPFLKATNLFDGIEGGDLTLTGTYSDSGSGSVFKGKADITEYKVKDAPVLAKILSLASLTGFFDTLQGNGIVFSKLRAPLTLANDVITVTDAKTHGDAMGMTIDGTITFPKRTLDLEGTIVPSYSLNSVLGKVPIVGMVLTGGEGQGVFAARYSIKGSGNEPKVSVNPLSILTPGFLRGLFDILDKPKKEKDKEEE